MTDNEQKNSSTRKKQSKGILKHNTDDNTSITGKRESKSAKWDEMNIVETLHPTEKDYGHMVIDEPKTPFNWAQEPEKSKAVDPNELSKMLEERGTDSRRKVLKDDQESDGTKSKGLTDKESFETKRKQHYNEFQMKQTRKFKDEDDECTTDDQPRTTVLKLETPNALAHKEQNVPSTSKDQETPKPKEM